MVLGLTACGGGSSPSAPGTAVPTLITPGAYKGSVNGRDWISIVLPIEPSSANVSNFYALHYNATDPDIYSGSGQITGNNSASLAQIKSYAYLSTAGRTGSAGSLRSISSGQVQASLNFPSTGSEVALAISLDHSAPTGYVYNTAANLSDVQGTWQGNLSYASGGNNAFSIAVSSQGVLSSSMSFLGDCQLTQSSLTPNFDGSNLFKFSTRIPDATSCAANFLGGQTLTGAAFVTPSPVAGKTQRLYLIGVNSDGRGISFKADR